jgi:hypothetical protein
VKTATIRIYVLDIWKSPRRTMGTFCGELRLETDNRAQLVQFVYRGDLTITYLIERSVQSFCHVLKYHMDQAVIERVKNE